MPELLDRIHAQKDNVITYANGAANYPSDPAKVADCASKLAYIIKGGDLPDSMREDLYELATLEMGRLGSKTARNSSNKPQY
jgi:hypothetical protein